MKRSLMALLCLTALLAPPPGARAAVYVVDADSPQADDAGPGSEQRPFRTIRRAAERVKAGDTVWVMAGSYTGRVSFPAGATGEPNRPIVFRAAPRHAVTMQGFDTTGCDWLRIEGFVITPAESNDRADSIGIRVKSHHVQIVDNVFQKVRWFAVSGRSYPADNYGQASHTYIACNKIHQCGFGIFLSGRSWIVERNQITRMQSLMSGADCDYTRPFGLDHVIRCNRFHGSTRTEVGKSHIDGAQYYNANGEYAANIRYERNVIFDCGQALYAPNGGDKRRPETGGWQFDRNIISHTPGGDIIGSKGVSVTSSPHLRVTHNTIVDQLYFGITVHDCPNAVIQGNLCAKMESFGYGGTNLPGLANDYNLTHNSGGKPRVERPGPHDVIDADPMLVDAAKRNFRLRKGSPAIGAGEGGRAIGALEYPNVYTVDSRHPGADDEGFGYPGWPFATVAAALRMAQAGETIILREGVYRETIRPAADGVTIKAAEGEQVVVSGADLVEGWQRGPAGWSAPLAAEPKRILRDGQPWTEFSYDRAARRITVGAGGDPRLHVFQNVVREHAIDLTGRRNVRIDGVRTADTLAEPVAGPGR